MYHLKPSPISGRKEVLRNRAVIVLHTGLTYMQLRSNEHVAEFKTKDKKIDKLPPFWTPFFQHAFRTPFRLLTHYDSLHVFYISYTYIFPSGFLRFAHKNILLLCAKYIAIQTIFFM